MFLFQLVGQTFLWLPQCYSVIRRYVVLGISNEQEEIANEIEDQRFAHEVNSLLYICRNKNVTKGFKEQFSEFHDFTLQAGMPMATILATKREQCRRCNKTLVVDGKPHVIVFYHIFLGSYLGSRITKCCRKCKIYEHYGFWVQNGKRHVDEHCLEMDFLLSSDETAFDMSLLWQTASLLVLGAVPFRTMAASYNRRFGYDKVKNRTMDQSRPKRMKRDTNQQQKEMLEGRQFLDRRRLEEAFLLFGALEIIIKYSINIENITCDRNQLTELLVKQFERVFYQKWTDHVCDVPGCKDVLVLDGNMKNARQVCSCRNIGELYFDGMKGTIVIGCQNTPSKSSRFCEEHKNLATQFKDDSSSIPQCEPTTINDENIGDVGDIMPVKVINHRETRQAKFYQVLWSNGLQSWVKEINLPKKVLDIVKNGNSYEVNRNYLEEFGQKRAVLQQTATKSDDGSNVMKSSGFAVINDKDNQVMEGENVRVLKCGTEKGKHKCKNQRTAGILVFEKPCGVVIGVRELFGSESKSQVYAHLHTLFQDKKIDDVGVMENLRIMPLYVPLISKH
ncbi:Hypothetical predicted protein [Paramuricea clavata]|uniref:Uncharacterized protein n=1 Tax=Paramuricea clavata TaxID=317549 RepID=A0A6S7H3I2_PARCT|nr:Hypothetical predicted protein [Paramuricea clavata]